MLNRARRHPDVKTWIAEALSDERYYCDSPPHWNGAETSLQAFDRHKRIERFLVKRFNNRKSVLDSNCGKVAVRLGSCHPYARCFSGACPDCNRALQRYFVAETANLLKGDFTSSKEVSALSLVNGFWRYLEQADLNELQSDAKSLLRKVGIRYAMGGVDLSYNQEGRSAGYWCGQIWAFVFSDDLDWADQLRGHHRRMVLLEKYSFQLRELLPYSTKRPVMVKPYDGNPDGAAYALKSTFNRRVSYVQEKVVDGVTRTCRNTSNQPLRVAERVELYPFLNQQGLASRIFLMGIRPTRTDQGISLVKLRSKTGISESSETPS